jgi:uncharacterized membrane protein
LVLIYLPVDYQIHLLNGWQVPIAILATRGLVRDVVPLLQTVANRRRWPWSEVAIRRWLITAFVLIISLTNLYLWSWRFVDLERHDYPYYLHKDEIAALAWLEANARPDDVVLSSVTIGQYIPATTGSHAFLAHWAQTLDFYAKSAMVDEFFARDTIDARRQQILRQYKVAYVFYGPAEQALGDYSAQRSPLLQLAFSAPQAKVYAVRDTTQ